MKITQNMILADVLEKHPKSLDVFLKHGLHCIGCAIASSETIRDAAKAHNLDLDKLLADLNHKA